MNTKDCVLQGACEVLARLDTILPKEEAASYMNALVVLVDRGRKDEDIEIDVIDLLRGNPVLLRLFYQTIGYEPHPEGTKDFTDEFGILPPKITYICPQCDYVWYRPSKKWPLRQCPTHKVPLILISERNV